jgi:hypothetical protein
MTTRFISGTSSAPVALPYRGVNQGGDEPGCRHHPTDQFLVFAFGPGTYSACGDNDRACHAIEVD